MFRTSKVFSSFAVRDIETAKAFYGQKLGLDVSDVPGMSGLMQLNLDGGGRILIYAKPDHVPATFTVLNIPVESVERAVDSLGERGIRPEIYRDGPVPTDARGILRDPTGPTIAWFKDPSGNILSVLEERKPGRG